MYDKKNSRFTYEFLNFFFTHIPQPSSGEDGRFQLFILDNNFLPLKADEINIHNVFFSIQNIQFHPVFSGSVYY